jgi:hypothetical protein
MLYLPGNACASSNVPSACERPSDDDVSRSGELARSMAPLTGLPPRSITLPAITKVAVSSQVTGCCDPTSALTGTESFDARCSPFALSRYSPGNSESIRN